MTNTIANRFTPLTFAQSSKTPTKAKALKPSPTKVVPFPASMQLINPNTSNRFALAIAGPRDQTISSQTALTTTNPTTINEKAKSGGGGAQILSPEGVIKLADKRTLEKSISVGDYGALGFDISDTLTAGGLKVIEKSLRLLKIPAPIVNKMMVFIKRIGEAAVPNSSVLNLTNSTLRFEFNFSHRFWDGAAADGAGNFHIKLSPKPAAAGAPAAAPDAWAKAINSGWANKLNVKLFEAIGRAISPSNPLSSAAIEAGLAPSKPDQGQYGLMDNRLTFNWRALLAGKNPNIRIGKMFVAINALKTLNSGKSKAKVLLAPYISPRIGADGSYQIVVGAGAIIVPKPDKMPKIASANPFYFPGFFVAIKLNVTGPEKNLVDLGGGKYGLTITIAGEKYVVSIPREFAAGAIDKATKENGFAKMPPSAKLVSIDTLSTSGLIDKIDPSVLDLTYQYSSQMDYLEQTAQAIAKATQGVLEILDTPNTALDSAISSFSRIYAGLVDLPNAWKIRELNLTVLAAPPNGLDDALNTLTAFYREQFAKTPGITSEQMIAMVMKGGSTAAEYRNIGGSKAKLDSDYLKSIGLVLQRLIISGVLKGESVTRTLQGIEKPGKFDLSKYNPENLYNIAQTLLKTRLLVPYTPPKKKPVPPASSAPETTPNQRPVDKVPPLPKVVNPSIPPVTPLPRVR